MPTSATSSSLHLTHCHALYAYQALRSGPIFTVLHETGAVVCEEIDWVRTSQAHQHWLPSVDFESRLLTGLAAAAGLGLVRMRLTAVAGDSDAYSVCWERRAEDRCND